MLGNFKNRSSCQAGRSAVTCCAIPDSGFMLHLERWSDSARTKKAKIGRHDNDYVAKLLLTSGGLNGQPGRTMLHQLRYADASITVLFMNLFGVPEKAAPLQCPYILKETTTADT